MKKNLFLHFAVLAVLTMLAGACSRQAEYTNAIPADVTEVAALNLEALANKAGVGDKDNKEVLARLTDALKNDVKAATFQQLEAVMKDPSKSGIDVKAPVYLFRSPSLSDAAIVAKVSSEDDLSRLLEATEKEGMNTPVAMEDGCNLTTIGKGTLLAFNASTLLAVDYGTASRLDKAKEMAATLLKQTEENSIASLSAFKKMQKMGGDINLLASPSGVWSKYARQLNYGLPDDVNLEALKLLGRLSFEKGKVELKIENYTEDAGLKALLEKQQKSTRPVENSFLKYFPKSTIALLSLGVNGGEFYNLLQENEQFRNEFSIARAAQAQELFSCFEGDVTIGLINVTMTQNPTFLAYAAVKDAAPLKALYEKKGELGLKRGEDIMQLNENEYVYKSRRSNLFFGIRDKQFYATNDELLYKSIGKGVEPSAKECGYASDLKGKRTAVAVNAEAILDLPVVKLLAGLGGSRYAAGYTFAGQIAYLEAVCDGEKTTLTLQLKEKDTNALKQLVALLKSSMGV